jgi:hypothetical protein
MVGEVHTEGLVIRLCRQLACKDSKKPPKDRNNI